VNAGLLEKKGIFVIENTFVVGSFGSSRHDALHVVWKCSVYIRGLIQ